MKRFNFAPLSLAFPGALLLGLAGFGALGAAQTIDKIPTARKEVLESVSNVIAKSAFVPGVKFDQWPAFLESERAKIDAAKSDDEFRTAVNAALRKFGFSHMLITTPKEANTRMSGKTVGVGITSQQVEEGRVVTRVVPDSPAERAGLQVGDIITHVDGKKIEGVTGIAGEDGTRVKLTVKKANGKVFVYDITRRPFSTVRKDELTWVSADTAVLKVNTFDRGYSPELIESLMAKALDARDLIVDLRFNGGGSVMNLVHLSAFFIDPKLSLGHMVDRSTSDAYKRKHGKEAETLQELLPFSRIPLLPARTKRRFEGNVVVLMNEGSASASEIFAGAMREQYGKYVAPDGTVRSNGAQVLIVGGRSAGAVLFSRIIPAAHGFNIQYPVADYMTPSGIRVEGNPIQPDIRESEPKLYLPTVPDPPVETALLALGRMRRLGG